MNTAKEKVLWNDEKRRIEKIPFIQTILKNSSNLSEFSGALKARIAEEFNASVRLQEYRSRAAAGYEAFTDLSWRDYAWIALSHILEREGDCFFDTTIHAEVTSRPLARFWEFCWEGKNISRDLLEELIHLFAQADGIFPAPQVTEEEIYSWMRVHPTGLEADIIARRKKNRERIINCLVDDIDAGIIGGKRYRFSPSEDTREKKREKVRAWWQESLFHLKCAIRSTRRLVRYLGGSIDSGTRDIMLRAEEKGIPIFVNPYYLSLLNTGEYRDCGDDAAIRMYVFYSECLIHEFGSIEAWEKEDRVVIGEPNAAGWILPSHSIHRRYPEVAILIPDTVGRACGGLCSSCQRMYGFQSGDFNFDLSKLEPKESWKDKLERILAYYEEDSQLRDILITGGDALMSGNRSLAYLFDRIIAMVQRKKERNASRSEKYAEIKRIRLGTRLPVYLPQRVDEELVQILQDFKKRAAALGIEQCLIQTHFESAMEITPEVRTAVSGILKSGWYITNQQVFTSAASLRGHTAKLRAALNDVGIVPYYTFSVKGFRENRRNFATNARIAQEEREEKCIGITTASTEFVRSDTAHLPARLKEFRRNEEIPFLASDRSVINLPGVGKSLTYRTVGFTDDGRRILEFDHDANRRHSPVVDKMGRVIIIESKSVCQYLRELEDMGESPEIYESIFGYHVSETEPRYPLFSYPDYDFTLTEEMTNFDYPAS
ncbi:MAG: KamA family radical SAM protein [Fibrobacterota bacterium]